MAIASSILEKKPTAACSSAPSALVAGRQPSELLFSGLEYLKFAKIFTALTAASCLLNVWLQHEAATEAFAAAERNLNRPANATAGPPLVIINDVFYDSVSSAATESPVLWFVFWYGLGSAFLAFVVAGLPILDIRQGVVHSAAAIAIPVVALIFVNLAWLWAWFAMHAQGWVRRSYGFFPGWFAVQGFAWALWPRMFAESMRPYIRRMYTFTAIIGIAVLAHGFVVSSVLLPLFNTSGEVGRILVRLVALTLVTEVTSMVYRIVAHKLLSSRVPGAVRGTLVLPISMFAAFVGRLFTTGMNSLGLTIALSLLGALLESAMSRTAVQRFEWYLALLHRVQRSAPCARCRCSRTAADAGGEGISDAHAHATTQRAHATFLLGETMASDIGMLTLIPVAIFFRLPTRIGGQPLPLGDVLLRVGFQWLLELCTDLSPFGLYAVGRAWLRWRGDTLYKPVSAADLQDAQRTARAALGGIRALGTSSDQLQLAQSDASKIAPIKELIDDSAERGSFRCSMPDPQATFTADSAPLSRDASNVQMDSTIEINDEVSAWNQPVASPDAALDLQDANADEPERPHGVRCDLCQGKKLLLVAKSVGDAEAESQRRIAPLLADDADVLWQRLPWTAVRAAMAPGAGAGEWSWLHWFTYRNELLAARLSAAWRRRQRGFLVMILVYAVSLHGFVMRTNLGTAAACPRLDEDGERFFDACSS